MQRTIIPEVGHNSRGMKDKELLNRIGQALAAFLELESSDDLTADRGYYLFNTLQRLYQADRESLALLDEINDEPTYAKLSQILELVSSVIEQRPEMMDQFEADLESGPLLPPEA